MLEIGRCRVALATRTPYTKDSAVFAHKTVIVGPVVPGLLAPTAFLIEQEPSTILSVHFHGYEQFEVITVGDGVLGSHALMPTSVHYAGQRTAYGSIKLGTSGLFYLTLRSATEGRAFCMPASRALRNPEIPRFERYGSLMEAGRTVGIKKNLEEDSLVLGAWRFTAQEGQILLPPAFAHGAGRFYTVIKGTWEFEGQDFGPLNIVWTYAQQAPLGVRRGYRGLMLLVVQLSCNAYHFLRLGTNLSQITYIGD